MARQSLKACQAGIDKAKVALTGKGWTQEELAKKVGTTRQPVANFFAGNGVDRINFVKICEQLELDWQEIADQPKSTNLVTSPDSANTHSNPLVQKVRENIEKYIRQSCSIMRVLDMAQPIGLDDIYIGVHILEKITGRRRLGIFQLLEKFKTESGDFDRFGLGRKNEECILGIDAVDRYPKLMVLGKPGAGKTTFLKYLAIQCIEKKFKENLIPFFIPLKDFSESSKPLSLYNYIVQHLKNDSVTENQIIHLLKSGKFLLLLDGLDEVPEKISNEVINLIKHFSQRDYQNTFVITCRIAAREYFFEQFTEVEVSDFNEQQIKAFVTNWFHLKKLDVLESFIQKLESNAPIKELATNPLLLTLLCLEFEDSGDFSSNRAELYSRAIRILLKKWDYKRGIVRDEVYKKLSVEQKEDLLSEISWTTFKSNDYLCKQRDMEEYIRDYIRNLPETKTDIDALRVDSEEVLKSIEAHHGLLVERATGIYSFSHLTFHEYFTARKIFNDSNQEDALKILASYISEKRWREVFLLTVCMLKKPDNLLLLQLMKQKIDALLEGDKKLQQFLTCINEKSCSVKTCYEPAAVRAFYFSFHLSRTLDFDLCQTLSQTLNLHLDLYLSQYQAPSLDFDLYLSQNQIFSLDLFLDLSLYQTLSQISVLDQFLDPSLDRTFNRTLSLSHDIELKRSLQELKEQRLQVIQDNKKQLSDDQIDKKARTDWANNNGQVWAKKLRTMMIKHRNIGHYWQFSDTQKELLQQYYNANLLLVDCLKSKPYVSHEVPQEIEDTLLLPVS